jgi:hypothetical protein
MQMDSFVAVEADFETTADVPATPTVRPCALDIGQ